MSDISYSAKPISFPSNVLVELAGNVVRISGPLGRLERVLDLEVTAVDVEPSILRLHAVGATQHARALLGTIRSLIINMIKGVSGGFEKKLILVGVGYRAQLNDRNINLNLGLSHPVIYELPDGVDAIVPTPTEIIVKGIDKQKVGQVCAEIRFFRKPEPYKGKGIRYSDETIVLKETKKK